MKVMVGMSGGVDSSVAAKLLLDRGYEVIGATLRLYDGEPTDSRVCCSLTDAEDARSVAYKLGFEHFVFNFTREFREKVIDNFEDVYLSGGTPNPCIECNRHIKFGKMLLRAKELGCDYIATGHYAENVFDEKSGRWLLKRPADRSKDQTYVLYGMTQEQLAHTLFPLFGMEKAEVRRIAEEAGLINSRKPDSQDICFVPDGDYAAFIQRDRGITPQSGDFTDLEGNFMARHAGLLRYTVGQRKGLGVSFGRPVFVIDKNAEKNTVILGDEKDLYRRELIACDVNLISIPEITEPIKITAKTRYSHREAAATAENIGGGRIKITFDEPQRAITRGQAVVMYDGDIVVGGGTII